MSEEVDTSFCCASCGITESDGIKLKKCTACKSVRYCGVECQREHRPQHKKACKKQAAELRDELLFKQPESTHQGDCPICMIPLSLDIEKSSMMMCCSKVICSGCARANKIRQMQQSLIETCPFCRKPVPTEEEAEGYAMKRIEVNDPVAMRQQAGIYYNKEDHISAFEYFTKAARLGDVEAHCLLAIMYEEKQGVEKIYYDKGDYCSAIEYYAKAAELGDVLAHYKLACCYKLGQGVEKDEKKELYHWEQGAIGGHPEARHNLGVIEGNNGKIERAIKHWIIAAKQGYVGALEVLRGEYAKGRISKESFAAALRAYQAAVDATKSPQREAAEEYHRSRGQNP